MSTVNLTINNKPYIYIATLSAIWIRVHPCITLSFKYKGLETIHHESHHYVTSVVIHLVITFLYTFNSSIPLKKYRTFWPLLYWQLLYTIKKYTRNGLLDGCIHQVIPFLIRSIP